ncbi:MAG TPA: hypothetical protein DDW52_12910 [Planctomycetaceae bacterium]|nr:hypothetical protein [Planctomycetaceae bacterium]
MLNPYEAKPSDRGSKFPGSNRVFQLQVRVGIALCAVFAFSAFLLWWFGWVHFEEPSYVFIRLPDFSVGVTFYTEFFYVSSVIVIVPCLLIILGAMLLVGHCARR